MKITRPSRPVVARFAAIVLILTVVILVVPSLVSTEPGGAPAAEVQTRASDFYSHVYPRDNVTDVDMSIKFVSIELELVFDPSLIIMEIQDHEGNQIAAHLEFNTSMNNASLWIRDHLEPNEEYTVQFLGRDLADNYYNTTWSFTTGDEDKTSSIIEPSVAIPLLEIGVALILAKVLAHVFYKIKQPSVLGEILAGVLLAAFISINHFLDTPFAFDFDGSFQAFSEIGILMLLFLSGMEVDLRDLKRSGTAASSSAIGGVLIPGLGGFMLGILFGFNVWESLALGTILTATSVGVTARTLMDLDELRSGVGVTVLSSAVIDDIMAILIMTLVLGNTAGFSIFGFHIPAIGKLGLSFVIFFLICILSSLGIISKLMDIGDKMHIPKILVSFAIGLAFIYSFLAQQLGLAMITGAFVAGLIIGNTIQSHRIERNIQTIAYALFIPLFFVGVGLSLKVEAFQEIGKSGMGITIVLIVLFIIIGVAGKIIGAGTGSLIAKLTPKESLMVGIGMVPRMEVALIVVSTAIVAGIFSAGRHASMALLMTLSLVIVTTLITPILLKLVYGQKRLPEAEVKPSHKFAIYDDSPIYVREDEDEEED